MLLNCGVGEVSWESLGLQGIKPVNPKGNQSWIFIGKTNTEAETPIFWPPDMKNSLIWKDPDAGKDWRKGEKGMTKDKMVGWHHWLNGHEFEKAPGVGDGQRSLACCSPWGRKESDMTEWLNWTDSTKRKGRKEDITEINSWLYVSLCITLLLIYVSCYIEYIIICVCCLICGVHYKAHRKPEIKNGWDECK